MSTVLDNRSPFAAELLAFPDSQGQEIALLVVSAAFTIQRDGQVGLNEEQPPVCCADECFGDPEITSLRYEADVALYKPAVDVLVNGTAYAPGGRHVRSMNVSLEIAEIRKRLVVVGDRQRLMTGLKSQPEPFLEMPIRYERAFGGWKAASRIQGKPKVFMHNPVGVGYRGALSRVPEVETAFPNIEFASVLNRPGAPKTAGFGAIGRGWAPRLKWAGTFDDEWRTTQWPLLPLDFDPRHNQSAPMDQQSNSISGGETVRLTNLTPDGEWKFDLPRLDIPLTLVFGDGREAVRPKLDTILLEPDTRSLRVSLRYGVKNNRRRPLREVVVGHMTRGWQRARESGKPYRAAGERNGSDPSAAYFR